MPRQRIPITFGAGLDRATGAGVKDARSLYDALNVVPREAGLELAAGMAGSGLTACDWGTDILAQQSVERTKDVLQVIYDRVDREIRVYRVNPIDTPTRQLVDTWGTLDVNAVFPVITMAEAGGVVYMAHAEPKIAWRLATVYWTPGATDSDAGTLTTASADFDGSGSPGDIYFYGVVSWREYIAGWGWGTEADSSTKDRPEIVHLSTPGDPLSFPPELYFICGTSSSRIQACIPMKSGLLVRSETEGYAIYGTDPDTFGVDLYDPSAGIVSPRAWYAVNGVAYVWSATGPRIVRDPQQASEDMAVSLDLMEATPTSWPARGPGRFAFCGYDPEQRVLYWVWPDLEGDGVTKTMAYSLSLRQVESPRFAARVFERLLCSAGRYFSGKVALPPGTGTGSGLTLTDLGWITESAGRSMLIEWSNADVVGSETVEVWRKDGSGSWAIHVSLAAVEGAQSTTITGLDSLQTYAIAIRLRTVDGRYTDGFNGDTPDDWTDATPANWLDTLLMGAATPTITSATFERLSSTVAVMNLVGANTDDRCTLAIEMDSGSGYVEVTTLTPSGGAWSQPVVVSALGGATIAFRARHKRGTDVGTYSTALTGVFVGIADTAPTVLAVFDISNSSDTFRALELYFRLPSSRVVQIELTDTGQTFIETTAISTLGYQVASTLTGFGSLTYRLRTGRTLFGVTDWGPWGSTDTVSCNPSASAVTTPLVDTTTFWLSGSYAGNFADGTDLVRDGESIEARYFTKPLSYNGLYQYVLIQHPSSQFTLWKSATTFFGPIWVVVPDAEVGDPSADRVTMLGVKTFLADASANRRSPLVAVQ